MFAATFLGIGPDTEPYVVLGAISVVAVVFLGILLTAVNAWQQAKNRQAAMRRIELEAALKRDMLERGMSADEIARVLGAALSEAPSQFSREALTR